MKKLKAVAMYTKFNYTIELEKIYLDLNRRLKKLKLEEKLTNRIRKYNFPCDITYWFWISDNLKNIHLQIYPKQAWDEETCRLVSTKLRRIYKIDTLERKFNEVSGSYWWLGKRKNFELQIMNTNKPPECQIVETKEVVTRYKSVCN